MGNDRRYNTYKPSRMGRSGDSAQWRRFGEIVGREKLKHFKDGDCAECQYFGYKQYHEEVQRLWGGPTHEDTPRCWADVDHFYVTCPLERAKIHFSEELNEA